MVTLGGEDHSLDEATAAELRDGLTRELGAPQALTDREAMLWAVAFEARLRIGYEPVSAAKTAYLAVADLRSLAADPAGLDPDQRAMLASMAGRNNQERSEPK
jgi:hypothetical protein